MKVLGLFMGFADIRKMNASLILRQTVTVSFELLDPC